MKKRHLLTLFALASFTTLLSPITSVAAPANNAEMQKTIREYIMKNPEVIVQSLQEYQQKQMSDTQKSFKKVQEAAPKYADKLFRSPTDPVAGNPKGTITIVEFSDYQCSHCTTMSPVLSKIIKQNPNVRVVLKEFPIRGPMSETAARAALAAQKQGKYYDFRVALMENQKGKLTEEFIMSQAKKLGLNVKKLKTDMDSKAVKDQLKQNQELAQKLKIMYTPVFFVAKTDIKTNAKPDEVAFIPGGIDGDRLNSIIKGIGS